MPTQTQPPQRGLVSRFLFLGLPLILTVITKRSPFLTHTMAPTQVWADSPIELVATPQFQTRKTDMFTAGASHMALLHNSILRGYNSIYLQAPHVQPADKADFVGYCKTWHKFVTSHHDDEEATLFTKVEELLDDKTVWSETHAEHEAFLAGLAQFGQYLASVQNPSTDFSGAELQRIMKTFEKPFGEHFHSEISTIAALADHPNAPAPGSPEEAEAAVTFKTWGKSTVSKAGTWDVVPFFLQNLDGTAEDGMWANWPPMPAPIRWGLVNIGGVFHGNWWKFSSCANGKPRELYALQGAKS
ncbi:uncharacterized protein B0I36DRAFT_407830 [Microdochium trichocladiopsis]|uniref:Hemerythrin-like domain-containing protein n=1 Tax=Microdochium trichocladiopsis TaxID=1682393 RepID=A0A9P8YBJ4_9PEZI|nr:uncharacterized protein B0I36DRAFT_407830 [Microdochium trichocladiopsis]KAH7033172.1 hypothetical protein B0I36DRAFT_407830 [Microdochium trichocladiopsis]